MKIKPEHIDVIAKAIEQINSPSLQKHYADEGLSFKRYQWDCLYRTVPSKWICDNIYPYANDDNIQSVLNKVIKNAY
jgi:hypothetical protein